MQTYVWNFNLLNKVIIFLLQPILLFLFLEEVVTIFLQLKAHLFLFDCRNHLQFLFKKNN